MNEQHRRLLERNRALMARTIRQLVLEHDNAGHELREYAVAEWAASTCYPAAIARRLSEICQEAKRQ